MAVPFIHETSISTAFGVVGAFLLSYAIFGTIYRLYFHPLAKFPGPKLAAVTLWYEFWIDCIMYGQYTFEIGRMHEKYGW